MGEDFEAVFGDLRNPSPLIPFRMPRAADEDVFEMGSGWEGNEEADRLGVAQDDVANMISSGFFKNKFGTNSDRS